MGECQAPASCGVQARFFSLTQPLHGITGHILVLNQQEEKIEASTGSPYN